MERGGWGRFLIDFTPLRESYEFRLLYLGQFVTATGSQITSVAAPVQVYQLTNSSLAVGLLGLAQLVPLFGLTPWLPLALVLLGVAGAADVFSAVFRNSILQLTVPDRLRGRLSATQIAVVTGGPRLGDAEAGAVAALSTPQISVVSGGLFCIAGAV